MPPLCQAAAIYNDLRSKFFLSSDKDIEGDRTKLVHIVNISIVCSNIMATVRNKAMVADQVKLMTEMKKVQATIRRLRVAPKDIPDALKEKYTKGLAMDM
jgi:predicted nucleic acid-binding Zn finger protein